MEDTCGYDMDFLEELADYLKCAICCLALKNPIQFIACGHRYCRLCFETLKEHSSENNVDLCCPIDRNIIDINNVFEDKGIERLVFDLQVKCSRHTEGCKWVGELRNLQAHLCHKCTFEETKRIHLIVKELQQRLESCEKRLQQKDEEIADMRDEFANTQSEITENVKVLQERLQGNDKEIADMRDDFANIKNEITENEKVLQAQLEDSYKLLMKKEHQNSLIENNKKRKLSTSVISDIGEYSGSFNLSVDTHCEENVQPVETALKCVLLEEQFKEIYDEVTLFQEKMAIVEQVVSNKEIKFKWHVTNYNEHKEKGEVFSPIFYACSHGHGCRLRIHWHGKEKDELGLSFQIQSASERNSSPFRISVKLEAVGKNGFTQQHYMSSTFMEENQTQFETPCLGGKNTFIKMPQLGNFIVNDSVFITCTLTPPSITRLHYE